LGGALRNRSEQPIRLNVALYNAQLLIFIEDLMD